MPQRTPHTSPILAGMLLSLAATVIWSGNFIISRGLGNAIDPVHLAFMRWATATICVLPFAGRAMWDERSMLRKHLPYLVPTAFLGVTVFNTLVYIAGSTTEALNMALISTATPIFIIMFARIFLGEAVTPRKLVGLAAAVTGVLLIITRGDLSQLARMNFVPGDLWMLLGSSIFAAYSIFVRRKPPTVSPRAFLGASFILGLAMLTPWAVWTAASNGLPTLTPTIIGSVLYIGIGASLISYTCWNGAVSRIGPARAGMVYYSLPLFSGIEAWLILGEPIGWQHLVGGAAIIGGIALANKVGRR